MEALFSSGGQSESETRRMRATPIQAASGTSGESLINRMLRIISEPVFELDQRYDLILVIDDLDCRFDNDVEA